MNRNDRSRRDHYEDEFQQDFYPSAAYVAQQLPYPDAAMNLYQQNAMSAQHRNGISQYSQQDARYYEMMQQNDFNNAVQPIYYNHAQELYDQAFEPQSRTTVSGTRTSTERTTPVQTSHTHTSYSKTQTSYSKTQTSYSRSTSIYGTSSSSSSGSYDSNWEDNVMSALNDMAGNLKKIGGIQCNQAGPDSTELQLKLNLPLPIENLDVKEGFNSAMATLSPKQCGNMQYRYSHLDEHVMDMGESFFGTMDQIQGNIAPVYKSLFESQSESSDDSDESESTYEDPRFVQKVAPNLHHQQYEPINVVENPMAAQNLSGVPSQIIVSNQPSGLSSTDSWKLLAPQDGPHQHPENSATKKLFTTIDNNVDVAINDSKRLPNDHENGGRKEERISATKQTLEVENLEPTERNDRMKSKKRDVKSKSDVPQIINVKNEENVSECYSDLTTGVRMTVQATSEKDKTTSNVPAIKTQFSGDEVLGTSKASFQRNSTKKGSAFDPDLKDLAESEAVVARSHEVKSPEVPHDEELEAKRRDDQERKRRKAEEKAKEKEAIAAKRLEERVEAELRAAREALKTKRLEEERKQREAEAKAAKQAFEAKRAEEEREKEEAEAKAVAEAKNAEKLKEERKRFEAEAKAAQEALELIRLEEERKRLEAEEKAANEARKAKKLEQERRRMKAETKAAKSELEALKKQREMTSKKATEEDRRQRKSEAKALEARKLKEVRERVEAETKAAVKEAKRYEKERERIETETKAVEKALKARKLEGRKRSELRSKPDPDEMSRVSRASLYKVQGFDDFCKSVASNGQGRRASIDMSDEETSSFEERSESDYSSGSFDDQSNSSNSEDAYSSDEESEIFTDATSFVEDSDSKMTSTSEVRSTNTTERLRNRFDQSSGSSISVSKSKLPLKSPKLFSSYTSDEPIPIAATLSTLQTFDQGTVYSGQQSIGRFIKSSDESVITSTSYSNQSVISAKPVALPVNKLPRDEKKESKVEVNSRSSILGTIVSFILSMALRILFATILFTYKWIKHLVITIGKKQAAKVDCTPTQSPLQQGQAIRREEIQDHSVDGRIHQNATRHHRIPYLGYEGPDTEHYTTTMIMRPPSYLVNDSDEVGTCVESIVPDTHYPNISDGKISAWKITQKNTETSSLSSPPSTSFRVLKSAFSALSSMKAENEKLNWMDHATIDDEISYYE